MDYMSTDSELPDIAQAVRRLDKRLGAPIWSLLDEWTRSCLVTSELLNDTLVLVHDARLAREQIDGVGAAGAAPLVDFSPVILEVFKAFEIQALKTLLRPFREYYIAAGLSVRLQSYKPSAPECRQLHLYVRGVKDTPPPLAIDSLLRLLVTNQGRAAADPLLAMLHHWLRNHCPQIHKLRGEMGIAKRLLPEITERNKAAHTHRFTPNEAIKIYRRLWGPGNASGIVQGFFKAIHRVPFDGEHFQSYRLTRRLVAKARFVMAEVYDEALNRDAVLALVQGDLRQLESRKRDIEARRACHHPHLLPFREVFPAPPPRTGCVAIVMESTGARHIAKKKKRCQRLSEFECLRLMRALTAAVAQMHERNMVHGFISPELVFCRPDGTWLLGGHAFHILAECGLIARVYPRTVPPEIDWRAHSFPINSATTMGDVFSIASTVCCLRAGTERRNAPPPLPADMNEHFLDPVLLRVLSKALQLEPRRRYPDAVAMLSDLAENTTDANLQAPITGSLDVSSRENLQTSAFGHSTPKRAARADAEMDFVLITALEEEKEALLAKLPGHQKLDQDDLDVHVYYTATVQTRRADGARYRVIVTCMSGMGPVEAAIKAKDAVQRWRPANVLLVGIAGGVKDEVELGDVIVADLIADYSLGKQAVDGTRKITWQGYGVDPRMLSTANNLRQGWEELVQVARPAPGTSKRVKGVIASGGDVVAYPELIRAYQSTWRKLVGVEMEGGGLAAALRATVSAPAFLMIRGVSDIADELGNSETKALWRGYACHVAAAYAIGLLQEGPCPPLALRP
jgi:nucleoside phosphorylase